MYIHESFRKNLSGFDLESISRSNDTVCIIDTEFRLRACNKAWAQFAANNNCEDVLQKYPFGCGILDACFDDAKEFYRKAYRKLLITGERFEQDYECSSDTVYRLFHQTAYPLNNKSGILITHHLVQERVCDGPAENFGSNHVNADNFIVQCAHCRKVKDHLKPNKWDWVPSLIRTLPNTSHTFCQVCRAVYYPVSDK
ncbi:MAG: hypothetical protein C4541_06860 [Candidatus Auribacter fodinae]|jgi:hypothetical protein|uniref:PAS domain-containing protein n=1 Tax=Candidatus Auribacter fodinae TaxID=2093366 RepID=A0A3A4R9X4_9BACT|nr:MAG: hypothetical protein C4541_06860 [Candidatus Auribacter fodinae]